ncbi:condensation domain-containing protein, partial [Kineococcus glutinatus]|uniref:condensation domain-containing protein n=1 Tax=Kineococcus glutinatus TaxID=1070872 RepID=UPI0031EC4746
MTATSTGAPTAAPRGAAVRLPLTGAQLGVHHAQLLDPGSAAFTVGESVLLEGPLEGALLEAAARRVVAEVPALRAAVPTDQDDPAAPEQRIADALDWPFEHVDLTAEPDPEAAAAAWTARRRALPLDPARPPLFVQALLRTAPQRAHWVVLCHHVVLDAYGLSLVLRRTAEVLGALADGRPVPPSPFGDLRDVVAAERAYRAGDRFAADREFWSRELAGAPEPVGFSDAAPAPAAGTHRVRADVDAGVLAGLDALAAGLGATWAELVLTAASVHLHRTTGERDLLLAAPAMGRLGTPAARVPAMVVNVLPLRLRVRPGDPVADVVAHVRDRLAAQRRHQRYRAEDIARDLRLGGRALALAEVNVKPFDGVLRVGGALGHVRNVAQGPVDDLAVSVLREPAGGLQVQVDAHDGRFSAAGAVSAAAAPGGYRFAHAL